MDELPPDKQPCRIPVWVPLTSAVLIPIAYGLIAYNPAPTPHIAVIHLQDASGKPVHGAKIEPYAMRPKKEGGHSGHYRWTANHSVPPDTALSDKSGTALIPYPQFVLERVETAEISVSIKHPEFVSGVHHLAVSRSPPKGSSIKRRVAHLLELVTGRERNQSHELVLTRGGILELTAPPKKELTALYAQSTSPGSGEAYFWSNNAPNSLLTRRHERGQHTVRLAGVDRTGELLFSDVTNITVSSGPHRLMLPLAPGYNVQGKLEEIVPRPVHNGIVIVRVSSFPHGLSDSSVGWSSSAKVLADGSFQLKKLPAGQLQVIALCDGYISVSGDPSKKRNGIPQKHMLGSNLDIEVDMEPTVRLEVTVISPAGAPVENAKVITWPNVFWENYGSTIFAAQRRTTLERLRHTRGPLPFHRQNSPPGFSGKTDSKGVAILSNVPAHVDFFTVEHPELALPARTTSWGTTRSATVSLSPGKVNRVTVKLDAKKINPLRHH